MLQKTLLNIEGLGRDLDPDLDLWSTAKPYLGDWMSEQIGWRGMLRRLQKEGPAWAVMFPQFPRLIYKALNEDTSQGLEKRMTELLIEEKRQSLLLGVLSILLTAFLLWQVWQ
jgi:ubiquinone biosynthesis protein